MRCRVVWDPAVASHDASPLLEGPEPGPLRHEGDFDDTGSTFPFGAHVSVVEVDTETDKVTMNRHIVVGDCWHILNPVQALFEWVQYDDRNPLTTNLADYTIPAASEPSSFEASNSETDSPRSPAQGKRIGEAGTIRPASAIQFRGPS